MTERYQHSHMPAMQRYNYVATRFELRRYLRRAIIRGRHDAVRMLRAALHDAAWMHAKHVNVSLYLDDANALRPALTRAERRK